MQRFIKFSVLFIFTLIGCTPEQQSWTEFELYDKAINVDNYVFSNGLANQVFYKVEAQYPDKDVFDFYKTTIISPWLACSENTAWESFADVSGNEPLFIHQRVQRWVNRDKSRLLLLAIKYRSPGSESRSVPDNNIQNVYLIEYFEADIDKILSALGITCNAI